MPSAARVLALTAAALFACVASGRTAEEKPRQLNNTPVLVGADELQYDQDLGLTVAKGHVELDQGDQILLADAVTYNQRTDVVTATGHVALLQPSGDITFADYAELRDQLRDGFIKDIRILLSDQSRLAGNTARRVNGIRTEIKRAVYSPCELCAQDPTKPPVWQIKAEEVVHDKDLEIVEYHDAVMEIDGIPVMYSPYFSHPDPSVKRASGFLPPTFGYGNTLGAHVTIPYYWAIAPDKDATFRPMLTSGAGVVLGGEYRQRFANGLMVNDGSIEAGGGRESISASGFGPPTGDVRGDIMGTGEWDLNDDWRAGYDAQRESDQTYMLRYHFETPANYLTSRLWAENFGPNSYFNISSYGFQSLNPLYGDSTQPVVLPVADWTTTSAPDSLGGRWTFEANGLDLLHRTGPEERRVSGGAGWQVPFNGLIGDRFTFSVHMRADGYSADHVPLTPNLVTVSNQYGATVSLPSNEGTVATTAYRAFPQAELKWNYPLVRIAGGSSVVVEPIVAAIVGPNGENPARIPNEDSQGFEFDEMSLFVPNRLPGYDRVDSGQRVDYGMHGEIRTTDYGDFESLIGESYRLQQNDVVFEPGSGLNDRLSDIVGRVAAIPNRFVDFVYRFRVSKSDFAAERQEASIEAGPDSIKGSLSFISIQPVQGLTSETSEPAGNQIAATLKAQLTQYWSVALNDTKAIGNGGATINSGVAVTYRDDCLAVVGSIVQSGIQVGDVRPGVSVLLTVIFKNLGEVGERVLSESGT
ncbi:MAG TPA: LPS assembly protein LptD [Stellaceae bacterium]|nr:LPS assembly protein LptD [Stellaceae bacterium]